MSAPYGMPGPGGSLGLCSVCGESFAAETLMNVFGGMDIDDKIMEFSIGGFDQHMLAHNPKCVDTLKSCLEDGVLNPDKLPDESPIRKALDKIGET